MPVLEGRYVQTATQLASVHPECTRQPREGPNVGTGPC